MFVCFVIFALNYALHAYVGSQFSGFVSTKVQILTPEALQARSTAVGYANASLMMYKIASSMMYKIGKTIFYFIY